MRPLILAAPRPQWHAIRSWLALLAILAVAATTAYGIAYAVCTIALTNGWHA